MQHNRTGNTATSAESLARIELNNSVGKRFGCKPYCPTLLSAHVALSKPVYPLRFQTSDFQVDISIVRRVMWEPGHMESSARSLGVLSSANDHCTHCGFTIRSNVVFACNANVQMSFIHAATCDAPLQYMDKTFRISECMTPMNSNAGSKKEKLTTQPGS